MKEIVLKNNDYIYTKFFSVLTFTHYIMIQDPFSALSNHFNSHDGNEKTEPEDHLL